MTKKNLRLYNVLFPIWFLYFFPSLWLLILPANFLIDSLVLYLSARSQKITERFSLWKRSILPVWIIGFLSDFAGAGLTVLLYFLLEPITDWNLILFPGTSLIALPGIFLSGLLIYFLNKKFSFPKSVLETQQIHKLCLFMAIFTAPYTMLIPLYG